MRPLLDSLQRRRCTNLVEQERRVIPTHSFSCHANQRSLLLPAGPRRTRCILSHETMQMSTQNLNQISGSNTTHRFHVNVKELELPFVITPAVDTPNSPELHNLACAPDSFFDFCAFCWIFGVLLRGDCGRVLCDWLHTVVWRDIVDMLRPNYNGQSPVSLFLPDRGLQCHEVSADALMRWQQLTSNVPGGMIAIVISSPLRNSSARISGHSLNSLAE